MKAPHMLSKAVGLVAIKNRVCQLAEQESKPANLERAPDCLRAKGNVKQPAIEQQSGIIPLTPIPQLALHWTKTKLRHGSIKGILERKTFDVN